MQSISNITKERTQSSELKILIQRYPKKLVLDNFRGFSRGLLSLSLLLLLPKVLGKITVVSLPQSCSGVKLSKK